MLIGGHVSTLQNGSRADLEKNGLCSSRHALRPPEVKSGIARQSVCDRRMSASGPSVTSEDNVCAEPPRSQAGFATSSLGRSNLELKNDLETKV
jgi:hypothetical protein